MSGKQSPEMLASGGAGIARAAELLRQGKLVALPTETVYGLAARADNAEAVAEIYRAKGRPDFNPLIVHVGTMAAAAALAEFDERALQLAGRFWPGPLTLVLRSRGGVAAAVTAGLPTVALRMPDHPVMQAVIAEAGVPLAAPSANRSGAVSPTSAEHVVASLGAAVDAVIDGGPCRRGVESTIVALRLDGGWQILRPGPITEEELTETIGPPVRVLNDRIEAPGQLTSHYAPGKPVRLNAHDAADDEFLIGFGPVRGHCSISEKGNLAEAAARLYECLHRAAGAPHRRIAVAPVPDQGLGQAINDRLRRAAA